jgi:hypothetical protein
MTGNGEADDLAWKLRVTAKAVLRRENPGG